VSASRFPRPIAMRVSNSLRRCSRKTATAFGGREMVCFPCLVLGGLNQRPSPVSSDDRSIRTVAQAEPALRGAVVTQRGETIFPALEPT
jgi:hypothetical protein